MNKKVVLLSREQILEADDLARELVNVEEWGGHVYVRALTGAERDAFEQSLVEERIVGRGRQRETTRTVNMRNARAKLCALTICDEQGERLFTDADVQDLGKKSAAALTRVYEVAARLSGLTDEDMEELTGNSDDDPSDGLSSD